MLYTCDLSIYIHNTHMPLSDSQLILADPADPPDASGRKGDGQGRISSSGGRKERGRHGGSSTRRK